MFHSKTLVPLLLGAGLAALLTGCGGGGGGGSYNGGGGGGGSQNYLGAISGKVVDTSGSPAPSAVVFLDGVADTTGATYQAGGYEVTGVTPGFHVVGVSTTVNNVTYTGATDSAVPNVENNAITNANVIVAPVSEQAAVAGTVTDSNGNPIAGARVSFQTAFAGSSLLASNSSASTAAIVAITDSAGHYQLGGEDIGSSVLTEPGLPVLQTSATGGASTPRTYTITASALPVNGVTYANAPTVTKQFTASATLIAANETNFVLPVSTAPNASGTTPTINYLLAFTQPDIPAYYPPQVESNAVDAVYEQVRQTLAPKYKQLETSARASAQVKHLKTAAQAHATANNYTIEMNLFFSLPGDTSTALSPVRSELSGFNILNDAFTSTISGYDYLQDPLANYYVDPDLGLGTQDFSYNEDATYSFEVQSVATDGVTTFTASAPSSVEPLSLVNLSQPADPNDNSGTIASLTANPTFIWTTVDSAQATVANNRVGSYYVFIYNTFPGVSTTPVYQSGALTPSSLLTVTGSGSPTENFTPSGLSLASGEYWVVVAATASDSTATDAAVSVSQIIPFDVP